MTPQVKRLLWPSTPASLFVGAMLGLVGLDLWKSYFDPPVVAQVEKPQVVEVLAQPEPQPEPETLSELPPIPEPETKTEVVNYSVFRTVPVERLKFVTGINYAKPDQPPEHQYCYVQQLFGTEGSVQPHLQLARKEGQEAVKFINVEATAAGQFDSTPSELEGLAREHCRFIEETL